MRTRRVLGALRGGDDNAFKILNKFSTDADGLARPRNGAVIADIPAG